MADFARKHGIRRRTDQSCRRRFRHLQPDKYKEHVQVRCYHILRGLRQKFAPSERVANVGLVLESVFYKFAVRCTRMISCDLSRCNHTVLERLLLYFGGGGIHDIYPGSV